MLYTKKLDVFSQILETQSGENKSLLSQAYECAKYAHKNQKRKS
jgi:(p)ppGpp synthase/HD superfamily hydrolase